MEPLPSWNDEKMNGYLSSRPLSRVPLEKVAFAQRALIASLVKSDYPNPYLGKLIQTLHSELILSASTFR